MKTRFISYPRSGRTWQEIRMLIYLYAVVGQRSRTMYRDMILRLGDKHFGFAPHGGSAGNIACKDEQSYIFVMARNAQNVIPSYFRYVHNVINRQNPGFVTRFGFPKDINKMVRSPWGARRICRFYNKVEKCIVPSKREFLFYEDAFSPEFIHNIPRILGDSRELSSDEVEFIFTNSCLDVMWTDTMNRAIGRPALQAIHSRISKKSRPNSIGKEGDLTNSQEMTQSSLDYIRQYMHNHCHCKAYLQRYC